MLGTMRMPSSCHFRQNPEKSGKRSVLSVKTLRDIPLAVFVTVYPAVTTRDQPIFNRSITPV